MKIVMKVMVFLLTFTVLSLYSYIRLYSFRKRDGIKYILLWTNSNAEPFVFMGKGQETFVRRHCPVNSCYVISDRNILNIADFDAILFHGPDLNRKDLPFPITRSLYQKYVFVSMETPVYYPLQFNRYDGTFNWTWTYKLSSNEYFGYIIIKNKQGDIIGPKEVMHWIKEEEMRPVDNEIIEKLKYKNIAAAWFVSNCMTPSLREKIANKLRNELAKYNMSLDIYGHCGTKKCPKTEMADCLRKIERDYYFYLSFENSFSEDYVTEKLLNALQHYAVPIVYGGANYTRFMPDGSYLNVRIFGIKKLVKKMLELMSNKKMYYNYFRWHNYYSYHNPEETPETDNYCRFCRRINDDQLAKNISIHQNFGRWWHH